MSINICAHTIVHIKVDPGGNLSAHGVRSSMNAILVSLRVTILFQTWVHILSMSTAACAVRQTVANDAFDGEHCAQIKITIYFIQKIIKKIKSAKRNYQCTSPKQMCIACNIETKKEEVATNYWSNLHQILIHYFP